MTFILGFVPPENKNETFGYLNHQIYVELLITRKKYNVNNKLQEN